MRTASEKLYNEYDVDRDVEGKSRAYQAGKHQQFPKQWNSNSGSNGSVSVSRKLMYNK